MLVKPTDLISPLVDLSIAPDPPLDLPIAPDPATKKATRSDKIVNEFEIKYHRFLAVKKKLNTFVRKTTKNKQIIYP